MGTTDTEIELVQLITRESHPNVFELIQLALPNQISNGRSVDHDLERGDAS